MQFGAFQGTKGEIQLISKRVSPWASTDREEHVGPSPGQVGPEGWPIGPTLVLANSGLGGYIAQYAAKENPRPKRR
jgi:hypothetical protein